MFLLTRSYPVECGIPCTMMILAEARLFFSKNPSVGTSQMLASSERRSTAELFFTNFKSRFSSDVKWDFLALRRSPARRSAQ